MAVGSSAGARVVRGSPSAAGHLQLTELPEVVVVGDSAGDAVLPGPQAQGDRDGLPGVGGRRAPELHALLAGPAVQRLDREVVRQAAAVAGDEADRAGADADVLRPHAVLVEREMQDAVAVADV